MSSPLASERQALFDTYDHLAAHDVGAYGGGMFEQGPGRGQLQYLASLFHPDAPNDVAPTGYNLQTPTRDLPRSPLAPEPHATGFRWGTYDGAPQHPRARRGSLTSVGSPRWSPSVRSC